MSLSETYPTQNCCKLRARHATAGRDSLLEIESPGRSRRDSFLRIGSLGRSRRDDLLGPPELDVGVPKVSSVTSTR